MAQTTTYINEMETQMPASPKRLTITLEDDGETLLTGPVVDQAALHGLRRSVRDVAMPLLSVTSVRPDQADG